MAFPYLIQVTSSGAPVRVYEVVVVTAENEWRRHFASGATESSFDKDKENRGMFATKKRAIDVLATGMSPRKIEFREGVSQKNIDDALKRLKEQKPKK